MLKVNYVKYIAKRAIWSLNNHNSEGSDIFLFTSRRSGGTYLMRILGSNPGVKYVREPFIYARNDPTIYNQLPPSMRESAWLRPSRDADAVMNFVKSVQSGVLHTEEPWNIFGKQHNFRTNRLVLKVHNVKHWIEWFLDKFEECHFIHLIRHPIPQALSAMRLRETSHDIRPVMDVQESKWLKKHYIKSIYNVLEGGSKLEKYVTRYLLENEVPYRLNKKANESVLLVTYEQLVKEPRSITDIMSQKFNLKKDKMDGVVGSKSGTVKNEKTRKVIEKNEKDKVRYLVGRWKKNVSNVEISKIKKIFKRFDFEWYSTDRIWPSSKLWH